jgi:hypothetical protein
MDNVKQYWYNGPSTVTTFRQSLDINNKHLSTDPFFPLTYGLESLENNNIPKSIF